MNKKIYGSISLILVFGSILAFSITSTSNAADCSTNSNNSTCPTPQASTLNRQEVQTGSSFSQKQALQNPSSTPNPNALGQKNSSQNPGKSQRDWRPKTLQTCVKGGITLQLKKAGSCPRGFVKK
jgi:hypothetical protein